MEQIYTIEVEPILVPRLMQSKETDMVILFTSACDGWVMHQTGKEGFATLEFNDTFITPTSEKDWKEFDGKIHLSNKNSVEWYENFFDKIRNADEEEILYPLPFPIIMKSKASNLIVLFFSEYEGLVLSVGEGHQVGSYGDDWTSCLEHNEWEVYEGIVELKN